MSVRIDKYLWAIRIFKTRSIATDECRKGRVQVNNIPVKPSRTITGNDIISVYKPPVTFRYRVIVPTETRMSAGLVPGFAEDLTPESEKQKLDLQRSVNTGFRPRGTGRPTKKERRTIDRWFEGNIEE